MPRGPDPDLYRSLRDGPEVETRARGSRFLAVALAVADDDGARARVERIRRRDHDATHHCWALRVGAPGEVRERFDDDGEPSGTAGRPILAAIEGRGLHGALVVVTRWFGGTKLGTGGLARAYGEAAASALDAAPWVEVARTLAVRVTCDFDRVGAVEAALSRAGDAVVSVERRFEPDPALVVAVRRSRAEAVARDLLDATAGRARVEVGDDDRSPAGPQA